MKIAYISADLGVPVLGHKGASVHVREFATALTDLGHTVQIISASSADAQERIVDHSSRPDDALSLSVCAPSSELRDVAQQVTEAFIRLGWQREPQHLVSETRHILADSEFTASALPLLRAFAPDLLIARHALFSLAGAELAQALGCPCALEVNAPLIEERRRYWGLTFDQLADTAERTAFQRADLLIAISEGVRAYLLRHDAPADRVLIAPNGVNLKEFHPGISAAPVRERYHLDQRLVIGFAGSLKPWHGVDLLMQAFADVVATREEALPALHLLIIGDGPQREALLQQSQRLGLSGHITFTGVVPHHEIPAHLAALDIAVAPYHNSDGFYFSPLKVIEYMAMGIPTIAPQIGQIPSLLGTGDNANGLLYPPDDRQELASGLLRLAQDATFRQVLGARGAARARQRHSWEAIAEQIINRLCAATPQEATPL